MRLAVVVASLLAVACSRDAGQTAGGPGQPAQNSTNTSLPRAVPAAAQAASPQGGQALTSVSGTVLDTMDSGGYTYLLIRTGGGDVWAAVGQAKVQKGAQAAVVNAALMHGFESKTLNRTFEQIYFGSLAMAEPTAAAAGAAEAQHGQVAQMGAQHAAAAAGPADVGDVKVAKAEGPGAKTVAEVWAGKAALKDKPVTVRGKVVKFNAGIMGRNWIHLRDGSGSREKKDDDLTVTTADSAAVGDVVLVQGTLVVDRDFGAGYTYPVLLQDARIQKK